MSPPRVRIAPSPTGAMHIGTARSALYNWLLARQQGGQFIVRIEDTDRRRSQKEYKQDILAGLKWLGLNWDEGPEVGGSYGPYHQSERTDLYQEALTKLIERGAVFYCFHSKEELAQEQTSQNAAKQPPVHWCDHSALAPAEAARRAAGGPHVLRFKTPRIALAFKDIIRGDIVTKTDLLGDFVVAKSLTEPLYNFAAVVDDAAMKITHVIRGEEHISNTPKQILMYQALGSAPPQFAHLPLILAPDRSKMSKRLGTVGVSWYREAGYLPEALINFIALLGWNPGGAEEIFSLAELTKIFTLERVRKSGAVFDKDRLDWFNGKFLRRLSRPDFVKAAWPFIFKNDLLKPAGAGDYIDRAGESWPKEVVANIIAAEQARVKTLAQVPAEIGFYFAGGHLSYEPALLVWKKSDWPRTRAVLTALNETLAAVPVGDWRHDTLENILMPLAEKAGDRGEILWPLRVALTGRQNSPGPIEVAAFLGQRRTLARLTAAQQLLTKTK